MVNMLASKVSATAGDGRVLAKDDNKPPSTVEMLTTELVDTYKLELEKIEPIAQRANAAPQKIESDDDLKVWSEIYLDTSALFKSLDTARLNEQRPLLAVFKTVFGGTLERAERIMTFGKGISDTYSRAKLAKERADREADAKRLRDEAEQKRKDAAVAAEFGDVDQTAEHAQGAAALENQIAQASAEAPKAADVARVRTDSGALSTVRSEWKFEVVDYSKIDLNAIRAFIDPKAVNVAIGKIIKIQKGETKIDGVRVYEDAGTTFRR
jgi:hypothetical protein